MIQNVWNWVLAHQVTVGLIIAGLISILNAATTVWSDHPKAIKWFTFIISLLSMVKSKGQATEPGLLGALKLPLVPEFPKKDVPSGGSGTIATVLLAAVLAGTAGCPPGNPSAFDPKTALNTACAFEPALNTVITVGVCDNLKEPSKSICLKVAAIAHTIAPAVLTAVGSIYDACRGAVVPRQVPKELLKPTTPVEAPTSQPAGAGK